MEGRNGAEERTKPRWGRGHSFAPIITNEQVLQQLTIKTTITIMMTVVDVMIMVLMNGNDDDGGCDDDDDGDDNDDEIRIGLSC